MASNEIAFVYTNIVIGGIQTLLIRISRALIKKGYHVYIYYNSIYPNGELEYKRLGAKVFKYQGDYPKNLKLNKNNIAVITFEVGVYIDLVRDNHKNNKDKNNIFLYSVHPYTFEYFYKGCKYGIFYKLFSKSFQKFVRESVLNGYVFFMDEQCLNSTSHEYGIIYDDNSIDNHILRIIYPVDSCGTVNSRKRDSFNILTVSRADFPFKGYIKGLIDCFCSMYHDYNIRLTIVTSGQQRDLVYAWSKGISNIEIVENVSYNELSKYYRNADIYVGMGTTILEAASEGIIAVPVSPYTYECRTNGLFTDNPNWVLTEENEGESIERILKNVISLSDTEREVLRRSSVDFVKKIYGEEVVCEKLERIILSDRVQKISQYKVLPLGYITFLKAKRIIKRIVKRQ